MTNLQVKIWIGSQNKAKTIELEPIPDEEKWMQNLGDIKILDMYNLGRMIFEIERYLNLDGKKKRKNVLNITKVEIPFINQLDNEKKKTICEIIRGVFLLIYNLPIEFIITSPRISLKETKMSPPLEVKNKKAVLLFSGGLDSILGLEYCKKSNLTPLLPVYISQKRRMRAVMDSIENDVIGKGNLLRISAPQISKSYFANTAGFLYCLTGSIFSYVNKAPLIIGECGVTSYQVKFGPLNEITYTTHPYIMDAVKNIYKVIFGIPLEIIMPFNDKTKAEMIAEYGVPLHIKESFSCLSSNPFVKNMKIIKNCGKCYACFVRRLAIVAAIDDPTDYIKKPFVSIKKEELLPLLEFCYILLKKFELLDYPQREKILKYNKKDLFERFAKDTFSALYKVSKSETLPTYINQYLKEFDKSELEERLKILKVE